MTKLYLPRASNGITYSTHHKHRKAVLLESMPKEISIPIPSQSHPIPTTYDKESANGYDSFPRRPQNSGAL